MGKKTYLIFISVICIICALCSCDKSYSISKKLHNMQNHAVYIPINQYLVLGDSSKYSPRDILNSRYKYVVYYDSMDCKPCKIHELKQWNRLLQDYDIQDVSCVFIFSVKNSDLYSYIEYYDELQLDYPIFFDKKNCFLKKNPYIPEENKFHAFLLDKNNNIILVGNPLYNEKIKNILLKIISS